MVELLREIKLHQNLVVKKVNLKFALLILLEEKIRDLVEMII
jgi:hypothetical protein